ncbi:alpha-D-ribose 1-methylphosphonate 5-triphosphate diphosphatase [Tateyamaria omphalii]|uniref:alpha-D-ribose 1-methylphosphonate 5-triphosphate diphosphatase n=1 Tax=Tateyamaria omphalii TaxID=299262 RepID=UPI001C9A1B82|nr:alpha-D-ribose 1-methylphosphonate 5-triphosphate diphosphatase [Tateyamaria omphalii]MBY5934699.1 alpha-D-ribose 1-methylphosphonate 5-triphosphate diphosphatase [Tateyamaria omphalii]
MPTPLPAFCMTGARTLRDGALVDAPICVADGLLVETVQPQLDLSGYLLLPGIIDLHGDAFEHHMAPRPSAPFPFETGLLGTDRDAAANGVTTAWMAQSWSWEGGHRGPDYAEDFLAAHAAYRPRMQTDLRIQIRCETHTVDQQDRLIAAIRDHGIDYVIFNNHLDEALELARTNPEEIVFWARKSGRSADAHMERVNAARAQDKDVPRYLCNLAAAFDRMGVIYGSHDDHDAATRERYSMIGAKICEFPTSMKAAVVARTWGDPILMGAPNVVRGGSQSGNIAASVLIAEGACDALVSDYYYPALAQAAFKLADNGVLPFAQAWEMISTRPAAIMGLKDRGALDVGKRADLTIVNAETRQIEATMAGGRWTHLCGDMAGRVSAAAVHLPLAAE